MDRINLKDELKLIKALSGIFPEQSENLELSEMTDDRGYMDIANTVMIVCHSEQAKNIFRRFTEKDCRKSNIPEMKYTITTNESGMEICSKYSIEYLMKILKCYDVLSEDPKFYIKKDYPIKIVGQHFTFLVAPRIEN